MKSQKKIGDNFSSLLIAESPKGSPCHKGDNKTSKGTSAILEAKTFYTLS